MGEKRLTEAEWREVFVLRCRSKRGERVLPEDHRLCERAFRENLERYKTMDADVFDATVPFGSAARWPRK